MAKFVFKFATVLQHRQRLEDDRQREMAQVMRLRMILLDQLKRMQQDIRQSKHDLAGSLVGTVDLDKVGAFARFAGQTSVGARQIVSRLAVAEKQIEAARARLLEATAARKAMELLRDRHWQQWRDQLNRRETAELDDLSMQAHVRMHAAENVTHTEESPA